MPDVIEIARSLIRCPSITPKDEGAQTYLKSLLQEAGFEIFDLPFGEGEDHVPNFFARIGTGSPHLCYAGHTDVVPAGPEDKWTYPPFSAEIVDGVLYGRGSSDMKGSVAAFTSAALAYGRPENGSISLLITGDEEGLAVNGTVRVLEWMHENGHIPDMAIVGEPTNREALGEEIKLGRRGSLNGKLIVTGTQGHVAYPHLADNPVPAMLRLLQALDGYMFDEGNAFFPPTNLEITSIDVGNPAVNVIPARISAHFNIRFNDSWSKSSLTDKLCDILQSTGLSYELELEGNAESFITKPGPWSELVKQAVLEKTGKEAAFTTSGGTSDARFVSQYCPTLEFGPLNATIHQIDENSPVKVLEDLTDIYSTIIARALSGQDQDF